MPGTAVFFESPGRAGFAAYLVMIAEIGGGLALITGLSVRRASLALISVLLGTSTLDLNESFGKSARATSEGVQT